MSLECSECERDLRGGHDYSCSRNPHKWVESVIDRDRGYCKCGWSGRSTWVSRKQHEQHFEEVLARETEDV